jgi:hypothetical protein
MSRISMITVLSDATGSRISQNSTESIKMPTQYVPWSSPSRLRGGKAAVWSENAASFDLVVDAT